MQYTCNMPSQPGFQRVVTHTSRAYDKEQAKYLAPATVQKIINEVLASPSISEGGQALSFAKETRDLLIECCVEFITMLSSEANEIAEKDAKKTIACEHITKALEELGFGDYVPELLSVAEGFKSTQAVCVSPLNVVVPGLRVRCLYLHCGCTDRMCRPGNGSRPKSSKVG